MISRILSISFFLAFGDSIRADNVTVKFGTSAITVNQWDGAVQIPVVFEGDTYDGSNFAYPTRYPTAYMVWYSQNGSAQFGSHYSHTYHRDYPRSWSIGFAPGDVRTKYITVAITYSGDTMDRVFSLVLDPSARHYYGLRTEWADAGFPSVVTVTIRGLSNPPHPPRISITTPRNGLNVLSGSPLSIRGTASSGMPVKSISVRCGGRSVGVRGTTSWTSRTRVWGSGRKSIRATVKDSIGRSATATKSVRLRRSQ